MLDKKRLLQLELKHLFIYLFIYLFIHSFHLFCLFICLSFANTLTDSPSIFLMGVRD